MMHEALIMHAFKHLCARRRGAFNHPHVSATEHAPPLPSGPVTDGWMLDHNRVQVRKTLLAEQFARRFAMQ